MFRQIADGCPSAAAIVAAAANLLIRLSIRGEQIVQRCIQVRRGGDQVGFCNALDFICKGQVRRLSRASYAKRRPNHIDPPPSALVPFNSPRPRRPFRLICHLFILSGYRPGPATGRGRGSGALAGRQSFKNCFHHSDASWDAVGSGRMAEIVIVLAKSADDVGSAPAF